MKLSREIHPDFLYYLEQKEQTLIDTFIDLRAFLLGEYPLSNELLYYTHALTAVYSISDKLSEGFCHVPIYTNHLNLGFNKGALIDDPAGLLKGTGKFIRHIRINNPEDYRNDNVKNLIKNAIDFELDDLEIGNKLKGKTISKIKFPSKGN